MGEGVRVAAVTVAALAGAVVVAGQAAFYNNYAFTKVMSECIGEAAYQEYQQKVAEARHECGGGAVVGGVRNPLFTSLFPGSFSINPFQGIPSQQTGGIFVQQPPVLFQDPGVFVQQRPRVFAQQPRLFSQQPPILQQRPGIIQPPGVLQQPGILQQQPGILQQQPGILQQQPGILQQQPGILQQQPGILQQPGVTQTPNIFSQDPNIFSLQSGSFSQTDGIFTQPPGIFTSNSGLFTTSTPSTVTISPDADTGVLLPPLAPRLPAIREKRALVLSSGVVEQAKEEMESLLGNLTCVLQKLAVVDENLEINYDALAFNTFNLPNVHQALKNDLLAALEYCRDTTRCLPVEKLGSPLAPQVQRIIAFVKCEKSARLSACLKHDLRRSLQQVDAGALPPGTRSHHLERLLSYLVGAESASELKLI